MPPPSRAERELEWLRRVRDLSQRLAAEPDQGRLLPAILDAAVELTGAERGFLVLTDEDAASEGARVVEARGFDHEALHGGDARVSRTVVRRVLAEGAGLVTTSDRHADLLDVSSVRSERVSSILSVPMRLRGRTLGVLYLDQRLDGRPPFTEEDVPLVDTFAGQAALALEASREDAEVPLAEGGDRLGGLVGRSPAMRALFAEIERASCCRDPALVLGEHGAGVELVARELHRRSQDHAGPCHVESCSGVPADVLAGELFGREATGSDPPKPGLVQRSARGTLILDDVDELPLPLQARLAQDLKRWEGAPGAPRLIAASHADLAAAVQEGAFRADLYYRLDVMRIVVPPLRQRTGDVPLLVEAFRGLTGRWVRLSAAAQRALEAYAWPGNVLELRNELLRLAGLGVDRVSTRHLSEPVRGARGVAGRGTDFGGRTLGEVEGEMVRAAFEAAGGNKAQAARQLGVPRSTLYHLLDRHGIE